MTDKLLQDQNLNIESKPALFLCSIGERYDFKWIVEDGDSAPMAICKAFLKLNSSEIPNH